MADIGGLVSIADATHRLHRTAIQSTDLFASVFAASCASAMREFNANNVNIARDFIDELVTALRVSVNQALAVLTQHNGNWQALAQQIAAQFQVNARRESELARKWISMAIVIGFAVLGIIVSVDPVAAATFGWNIFNWKFSSGSVLLMAAGAWLTYICDEYYQSLRAIYLHWKLSQELPPLVEDLPGKTIKTTVYRDTTRREFTQTKGRHDIVSFPVTKLRRDSYLLITGSLSMHHPHLGHGAQRWQFGNAANSPAQTFTYTNVAHGVVVSTMAIINDHELTGQHTLTFYVVGPANLGNSHPAVVLNPAPDGIRNFLDGQTNSCFRVDEIVGNVPAHMLN